MSDRAPPTCRASRCEQPAAPSEPFCPECDGNLSHLYTLIHDDDGLGLCGCGNPEQAYALVTGILKLAPLHDNPKAVRDLFGDGIGSDGAYHVTLSALSRAGLIEHGGSISASWLTKKGEHYLPLLERYEADDLDETGYPHDGDDCPPACPHGFRRDGGKT